MYLLDTNTCIVYLKYPESKVRRRLATLHPNDIAVCSVVKAELFYGAMRSRNPERTLTLQQEFLNLFVSLPFDDTAAIIFGRVRSQLAAMGRPIGPYDLQLKSVPPHLI